MEAVNLFISLGIYAISRLSIYSGSLHLWIGWASVQELMLLVFLGHSAKAGLCNLQDLHM